MASEIDLIQYAFERMNHHSDFFAPDFPCETVLPTKVTRDNLFDPVVGLPRLVRAFLLCPKAKWNQRLSVLRSRSALRFELPAVAAFVTSKGRVVSANPEERA